jgi:hypothetical protein
MALGYCRGDTLWRMSLVAVGSKFDGDVGESVGVHDSFRRLPAAGKLVANCPTSH